MTDYIREVRSVTNALDAITKTAITTANEVIDLLEQMNRIVEWQTGRIGGEVREQMFRMHPLTCGNDSSHALLFPLLVEGHIVLACPDCDYTQTHIPPVIAQVDTEGVR